MYTRDVMIHILGESIYHLVYIMIQQYIVWYSIVYNSWILQMDRAFSKMFYTYQNDIEQKLIQLHH